MIPLNELSVHSVEGADAGTFLQAQLAADLSGLQDRGACFSACCSPRGQVLALLLVQRAGSSFHLVGNGQLLNSIVQHLSRYVLRSRVRFMPREVWGCFGIEPGEAVPAEGNVVSPHGVDLRYALTSDRATRDDGSAVRWKRAELARRISWLSPAVSERFIPQMLGYEHLAAISFAKGCYPGQEVIARTRYLGTLKRRPVLLETAFDPALVPGAECSLSAGSNEAPGVIVEVAGEPDANATLLAVAPWDDGIPVEQLGCSGRLLPARRIAFSPPT